MYVCCSKNIMKYFELNDGCNREREVDATNFDTLTQAFGRTTFLFVCFLRELTKKKEKETSTLDGNVY